MIKAVIHPIRPTFMQYASGKNSLKRNGIKSQHLTFRRSMDLHVAGDHKRLKLSCAYIRAFWLGRSRSRMREIQFQNSFNLSNCLRIILRAVV